LPAQIPLGLQAEVISKLAGYTPFWVRATPKWVFQPIGEWTLFDNSSSPLALTVAAQAAQKLTVTETTTWLKLQKLSKVV
jgi:hypothetical protein